MGSETKSYNTNELFDPSDYTSQALYFIDDDNNGDVYIYGKWSEANGYEYESHNGNNLYYNVAVT